MATGFEHAPITKSLCILAGAVTILLLNEKPNHALTLDLKQLFKGELWRIILSPFGFYSMPHLVIGLMLMYSFRQFERQLGSRKFGSFVAISLVISILIQLAIVVIGKGCGIEIVPTPGPFFFIYSLLPLFYQYIPTLHPTKLPILGLALSEKSWTYLLACQLIFSDGTDSFGAGISGLIAGYLYTWNGLGLQEYRLPALVETPFVVVGRFLSGLFSVPGPAATVNRPATRRIRTDNFGGGAHGLGDQMLPTDIGAPLGALFDDRARLGLRPREEDVLTLMNLGFDRSSVERALLSSGNNMDAAANILLSGGAY